MGHAELRRNEWIGRQLSSVQCIGFSPRSPAWVVAAFECQHGKPARDELAAPGCRGSLLRPPVEQAGRDELRQIVDFRFGQMDAADELADRASKTGSIGPMAREVGLCRCPPFPGCSAAERTASR